MKDMHTIILFIMSLAQKMRRMLTLRYSEILQGSGFLSVILSIPTLLGLGLESIVSEDRLILLNFVDAILSGYLSIFALAYNLVKENQVQKEHSS